MHNYLKSIGFSNIDTREELEKILKDVVRNYDEKVVVESSGCHLYAQMSKSFGCDIGLTVCGEYDRNNRFHMEYYFPYFTGTGVTTQEQIMVERHGATQSFAGACDDVRIGVTIIFYVQNPMEYMNEKSRDNFPIKSQPITLSALADEGKILLSVSKDKEAVRTAKESSQNRNQLIQEARKGDEEAIENLTMDDIDTYSMITQRIQNEDVFSIVDTFFMPYGIECDKYNIMGEIVDSMEFINTYSDEKIYHMTLECNDLQFDVCINEKDLTGVPAVGRRFKGTVWLQGQLHF